MGQSDHRIVESIMAGETDQYRLLVEKYQQPVYHVILKIVNSPYDAQELTQDVFIRAYESIHQYKPDYKFFSWLYRIAINRALAFARQRKRLSSLQEIKTGTLETPDRKTDYEQRDRLLSRLINELSEHYQSVLLLKYYSGLSYEEIAETLQIPEKKVKSRLFDARKILREKLIAIDFFSVMEPSYN